MDEPGICKDCAHYHDEVAELPMLKRLFAVRTMFSETCDHPKFRDAVDGSAYPCVTARLNKCNGLPPLFADKRPNAEFSGTPAALSPEAPLERRVGPGAQGDEK